MGFRDMSCVGDSFDSNQFVRKSNLWLYLKALNEWLNWRSVHWPEQCHSNLVAFHRYPVPKFSAHNSGQLSQQKIVRIGSSRFFCRFQTCCGRYSVQKQCMICCCCCPHRSQWPIERIEPWSCSRVAITCCIVKRIWITCLKKAPRNILLEGYCPEPRYC